MFDVGWHAYDGDRELLERLNLPVYSTTRGEDGWYSVGTADVRSNGPDGEVWARVHVAVYCAPAQFFRFTIDGEIEDVHDVTLATGSGSLSDFWPTVELFTSGAMAVKA